MQKHERSCLCDLETMFMIWNCGMRFQQFCLSVGKAGKNVFILNKF